MKATKHQTKHMLFMVKNHKTGLIAYGTGDYSVHAKPLFIIVASRSLWALTGIQWLGWCFPNRHKDIILLYDDTSLKIGVYFLMICLTGHGTKKIGRRNHDGKSGIYFLSHGINDIQYITGESRNKKQETRNIPSLSSISSRTICCRPVWMPRVYGISCGWHRRSPKRSKIPSFTSRSALRRNTPKTLLSTTGGGCGTTSWVSSTTSNCLTRTAKPIPRKPRQQGHGVAVSGIQERHSPSSRHVLPYRRTGKCQQRPWHTPASTAGSRACGLETGLDDRRRGAGDKHRACEPGLHGTPAIYEKQVMGRVRGRTPEHGL